MDMKLCIWPCWERRGAKRVHLTAHEGLMMLCLLGNREVTLDLFVNVLWPHPDDMPDWWYRSFVVRLGRLRAKLRPFRLDDYLPHQLRLAFGGTA